MRENKYFGYLFVAVIAIMWIILSVYDRCSAPAITKDTIRTEKTDTVYIVKRDTIPQMVSEKIVKYVKIPQIIEHVKETCKESLDSLTQDSLIVVQREYTDDSTYTAYVSGLKYSEYPKLDSIAVRQREITRTIHDVVTITKEEKAPRVSFGVQAGYGLGIVSGKFEPYIGVGIGYRLW